MTVRFWAASGSEHMQGEGAGAVLESDGFEIVNLVTGATDNINRLGFFGAGGPGTPVTVNTYQSTVYPTDHEGDLRGPPLVQSKYLTSNTVEVSGAWNAAVAEYPPGSSTVQIRFTEDGATAVTTQNAELQAVLLGAASGVAQDTAPNNITIQAFEVTHPFGLTGDSAWTELTSGPTDLSFDNHSWTSVIHDFFAVISASPTAVGVNRSFGFYFQTEYI